MLADVRKRSSNLTGYMTITTIYFIILVIYIGALLIV